MWTRFMDMHSGGGCKEPPYEYVYMEAEEDKAVDIFIQRFGHDPRDVACSCCGENYSISESMDLAQASAYNRGCSWDNVAEMYVEKPSGYPWAEPYMSVTDWQEKSKDVLVLDATQVDRS